MRAECHKPGIATAKAFVLVEWCSILIQHVANSEAWNEEGRDIVLTLADALEKCLQPSTRRSIAHSATVVTRRALRKLFSSSESRDKYQSDVVKLLSSKQSTPAAHYAPLLGVVAGVSARQEALKPGLEGLSTFYYDFYTREIVGAKTSVPQHIAGGLADFFSSFATLDDVEAKLIPSMEKALLRSPEVILNSVLKSLVLSFPKSFDLSKLLHTKLLKPILSNVKSSNASIRSGALESFKAIISRCHDNAVLAKVVEEIATPLKGGKLASPEQRALHAEMLREIPLSDESAATIVAATVAVAGKEGNEAALAHETAAMALAISYQLESKGEVQKTATDTLAKGLADKKPASRRLWLMRVGEIVQSLRDLTSSLGTTALVDALIPKLIDVFNEVTANPPTAAQNGTVVGAYILTAVTSIVEAHSSQAGAAISKASVQKVAQSVGQKNSFLCNSRVYSKLAVAEDFAWLNNALSAVADRLDDKSPKENTLAWADAIIHLITNQSVPPKVQKDASVALQQLYLKRQKLFSTFIIDALWASFEQDQTTDKDAKVDNHRMIEVLRSICPEPGAYGTDVKPPTEVLEAQACSLLVLARPELIPRSSWIELCLRVGLDPGELARKHEEVLVNEIFARTSPEQKVRLPSLTRLFTSTNKCSPL